MSTRKTVFETLSAIDVEEDIKDLQGANYLPWADGWNHVKKVYPLSTYKIETNSEGLPYFASGVGVFIKVCVKIEEETQELFMPVLNSAHKTLKLDRYSYTVKEYKWDDARRKNIPTGKMIEKFVEPVTSFDINTAHMRGLVKCLALMGLAIYIYRDEAMPEEETVGSAELQQITALCKEKNYQIASIATEFGGYAKIADIPSARFNEFMTWANPS